MDMYFCLNINNFFNANKLESIVKLYKVLLRGYTTVEISKNRFFFLLA